MIPFLLTTVFFLACASAASTPGCEQCSTEECRQCMMCQHDSVTIPADCGTTAPATPADCASTDWNEGIAGMREVREPMVDPLFTACHADTPLPCFAVQAPRCYIDPARGVRGPFGVDLGGLTTAQLSDLDTSLVETSLKAQLLPLAGKRGLGAAKAICGCGVSESRSGKARSFFQAVLKQRTAEVAALYDSQRLSTVPAFASLQRCFRTALVDMLWSRTPADVAHFWAAARVGDWARALREIYAFDCVGCLPHRQQLLGRMVELCRQECGVDMFMLLDASGSVGAANFQTTLRTVNSIVKGFTNLTQAGTRVGLATYSTYVTKKWGLSRYNSETSYLAAIDAVPYTRGSTYTGSAIDRSRAWLLAEARVASLNVPRVLVTITDGKSHDDVVPASNRARSQGIATYAIGVGSGADMNEVGDIAGSQDNTFRATDFAMLERLSQTIGGTACLAPVAATDGTITVQPGETRYLKLSLPTTCSGRPYLRVNLNLITGGIEVFVSYSHKNPNPGRYNLTLPMPQGSANQSLLLSGVEGNLGQAQEDAYMAVASTGNLSVVVLGTSGCCGSAVCEPSPASPAPSPAPPLTEAPRVSEPPLTCEIDLLVLLDESGSIRTNNFGIIKEALMSFISSFNDLSPDGSRIGVATYNRDYKLRWEVGAHESLQQYAGAVGALPYRGGGTLTGSAVRKATADLVARSRGGSTRRVLVTFTDGLSHDRVAAPSEAARVAGIETFAVGVTSNIGLAQIQALAGNPSRVFLAPTFEKMRDLAGTLGSGVCQGDFCTVKSESASNAPQTTDSDLRLLLKTTSENWVGLSEIELLDTAGLNVALLKPTILLAGAQRRSAGPSLSAAVDGFRADEGYSSNFAWLRGNPGVCAVNLGVLDQSSLRKLTVVAPRGGAAIAVSLESAGREVWSQTFLASDEHKNYAWDLNLPPLPTQSAQRHAKTLSTPSDPGPVDDEEVAARREVDALSLHAFSRPTAPHDPKLDSQNTATPGTWAVIAVAVVMVSLVVSVGFLTRKTTFRKFD